MTIGLTLIKSLSLNGLSKKYNENGYFENVKETKNPDDKCQLNMFVN